MIFRTTGRSTRGEGREGGRLELSLAGGGRPKGKDRQGSKHSSRFESSTEGKRKMENGQAAMRCERLPGFPSAGCAIKEGELRALPRALGSEAGVRSALASASACACTHTRVLAGSLDSATHTAGTGHAALRCTDSLSSSCPACCRTNRKRSEGKKPRGWAATRRFKTAVGCCRHSWLRRACPNPALPSPPAEKGIFLWFACASARTYARTRPRPHTAPCAMPCLSLLLAIGTGHLRVHCTCTCTCLAHLWPGARLPFCRGPAPWRFMFSPTL